MDVIFKVFLVIHATAGGMALLAGSINMIRKKGDTKHAKMGLIYFYSVLLNALSAFFLAIYHPNLFLFSLGVLSFYLISMGRRNLLKSTSKIEKSVQLTDWLLAIGLFCFGIILTIYSIYQGFSVGFNIIPFIFGVFPLYISILVIRKYKNAKQPSNADYVKGHIVNMMGSYITILSAFLVVNNRGYFPVVIGWFGPALVLVPLIMKWSRKFGSVENSE